jgi:hypothetical protein
MVARSPRALVFFAALAAKGDRSPTKVGAAVRPGIAAQPAKDSRKKT